MTDPTPERNSWAVSDAPNGVLTVEDARLAVSALVQPGPSTVSSAKGLRPGGGEPGVVAAAPTPDTTVTVQPFQMFMPTSRGAGGYVQTMDIVKTLDLLTDHPADPANPRHDLIIAQQADKEYGDEDNAFTVRHVVGGASGPPDPVPGSPDHVVLAKIRIPAGARTVTPDMIDNVRPRWVVGLGGVVPVRDTAERDATAGYDGLVAYRQDRGWLEVNDGASWRVPSMPICTSPEEIRTSITGPVPGQLAFSTEDDLVYRYTGSEWIGVVATGGTRHEARYERAGNDDPQEFRKSPVLTKIRFPVAQYDSPDVTRVPNIELDTFQLERSGLWSISVNQRVTCGSAYTVQLYLVESRGPDYPTRFAGDIQSAGAFKPSGLTCVTAVRLTAGTLISAVVEVDADGCRAATPFPRANHIAFTWLRP